MKKQLEPYVPLSTPVLFLVCNRPETTRKVFDAIRQAKPPRLYIAADGPRLEKPGEAQRVAEVRRIVQEIDWECRANFLFREDNLGCGRSISGALQWFFDHEEEGIILEDDCLPEQSFFWFCQELLEKFRTTKEVGAICGFYSNEADYTPPLSYFFSRYLRVWGWAGWKRTIDGYEFDLKSFDRKDSSWSNGMFLPTEMLLRWLWRGDFCEVKKGKIATWAYQLQYLLWQKKQLVVVPSKNQISNIGWEEGGVHASRKDHNHDLPTKLMHFPLQPPQGMDRNVYADRCIEKNSYGISWTKFLRNFVLRLVR